MKSGGGTRPLGCLIFALVCCAAAACGPRDHAADARTDAAADRAEVLAADAAPARDVASDAPPPPADAIADALAPGDVLDGTPADAPSDRSCARAVPVADGARLAGQDSTGTVEAATACAPGSTRSVLYYYSASVPAGYTLVVTATPPARDYPTVQVLDGCAAAAACLAWSSGVVAYTNRAGTAASVIIAVSSPTPRVPTRFDLSVSLVAPAPHAACSAAVPVTDGTRLVDQDLLAATTAEPTCGSVATDNALYYAADVPAGAALTARATPTGAYRFHPRLRLLDRCSAGTCLANQTGFSDRGTALIFTNRGAGSRRVILVVSGAVVPHGTRFDLAITIRPPEATAACTAAPRVADGTMLAAQSTADATDLAAACLPTRTGPVVYYSALVPAGHVLSVRVTPVAATGFDPVIRLMDGCAATSCLAAVDQGTSRSARTAAYYNRGAVPQTVIVAVGHRVFAESGAFDLAVAIRPPAANAACGGATPVTDGASLTAQNTAYATDPVTACRPGDEGKALYYRLSLPAGYTLVATPRSVAGTFVPLVARLLEACGAASCIASTAAPTLDLLARLIYTNRGTTTQDLILAVGTTAADFVGSFDLAIAIRPPPPNTTCAAATRVAGGAVLPYEIASAASEALATACLPTATGNVLYYRATVPPGQTVTAIATPLTPWNVVLRVLGACGASGCAGQANYDPRGGPEVVQYANTGAAPVDAIIVVGGDGVTTGLFELAVLVEPPRYVETRIPTACDDLGTAPAALLPSSTPADGPGSPVAALPFAFDLVGETMTHVGFAQWGYLQLLPGPDTLQWTVMTHAPMPHPARPNRVVAPLWTALVAPTPPVPATPTDVRARVFGTAPARRFTVEWRNWVALRDPSTRLTFQARLFERTNVVEFHYCSAVGGSGASATVGVEDSGGMRGVQHSYDDAAGVSATSAIRLTPAM